MLAVAGLVLAANVGASRLNAPSTTSTSTVSYQGRLADSGGTPLTGMFNLEFRIYDLPTGGTPLWEEFWMGGNSVAVSDGLFNVMLGSINTTLHESIVDSDADELFLGIEVDYDGEMAPRVQLGSVPFSMQAMTVPDLSITSEKVADGAVTMAKLGDDVDLVPSYEGFRYYTSSFFKPAGWQPTVADTLVFNTFGDGSYNRTTRTFIAPKAGYWRSSTYGFISTAAVGNERIGLGISGGTTAVSGGQFSAGDTPDPHFSHVMHLDVGGSVGVSSYTPIDCTFGGVYPWYLQGEYLGE